MPIYVYKYLDTGETFEVLQKSNERPLTEYKGKKVKKIPASFGMNLKGSGFYKTDYKDKK